MKKYIFMVVASLCLAISAAAQAAPAEADLTKLLNEFLAGAGKNEVAMHDRFWADDLIYTRSAGVRINKAELMKGVRSATAPKADDPVVVYTAEDIQVHQYGNTAVVAFRLVITTKKADGTTTVGNNLNTGTFVKRNGIWQAVAWQSTVVPSSDAPKAAAAAMISTPPAAAGTRVYQKGSRGGCFYLSSSGSKIYVDHKYCN